eukprot:1341365-Rhodomonas_salina.1
MDHTAKNCHRHYYPDPDIAYDEISCQMSCRSIFKKQLRHKPGCFFEKYVDGVFRETVVRETN